MATRTNKTAQLCCVTIGYSNYLMPADKGMKLVELLQSAIECEQGFDRDYQYRVRTQPAVEFRLVKPSQVIAPTDQPTPGGAASLTFNPTRRLL